MTTSADRARAEAFARREAIARRSASAPALLDEAPSRIVHGLVERGTTLVVLFGWEATGRRSPLVVRVGEDLVLGRSVEELGRREAGYRSELEQTARRVAELDAHDVPTRYPNGLPAGIPPRVFGSEPAERALALAREEVEAVRSVWPG